MQATFDPRAISSSTILEDVLKENPRLSAQAVQCAANDYLLTHVASSVGTVSPVLIPGIHAVWRMVVQLCNHDKLVTVGTIDVDAHTGAVVALTDEQIEDMRDRIKAEKGDTVGILRPTAQIRANGYLTNYVSLFAKADRPVWVEGNRPVWRSTVFLRLRGQERVCDLGVIEVDAQTGDVIPLTNQQLQAMRKCVQDAAKRTALAAATTR